MLYLVIHSSASQRPWVRTPETIPISCRSIWNHWYWSLNLESQAHLEQNAQHKYTTVHQQHLFIWQLCTCYQGGKKKDHQAVPKALVVEAGLLGHPGGIPAAILVLIRAADLV